MKVLMPVDVLFCRSHVLWPGLWSRRVELPEDCFKELAFLTNGAAVATQYGSI
jgi:hypothetical protein